MNYLYTTLLGEKMKIIYGLLIVLSLGWASVNGAEEASQGQKAEEKQEVPMSQSKLHETNCISCHASMFDGKPYNMYTRNNRKVKTAEGLRSRVQMCATNLNLQWFDEDVDQVTQFLNREFYHFEAKTMQ